MESFSYSLGKFIQPLERHKYFHYLATFFLLLNPYRIKLNSWPIEISCCFLLNIVRYLHFFFIWLTDSRIFLYSIRNLGERASLSEEMNLIVIRNVIIIEIAAFSLNIQQLGFLAKSATKRKTVRGQPPATSPPHVLFHLWYSSQTLIKVFEIS